MIFYPYTLPSGLFYFFGTKSPVWFSGGIEQASKAIINNTHAWQ